MRRVRRLSYLVLEALKHCVVRLVITDSLDRSFRPTVEPVKYNALAERSADAP